MGALERGWWHLVGSSIDWLVCCYAPRDVFSLVPDGLCLPSAQSFLVITAAFSSCAGVAASLGARMNMFDFGWPLMVQLLRCSNVLHVAGKTVSAKRIFSTSLFR